MRVGLMLLTLAELGLAQYRSGYYNSYASRGRSGGKADTPWYISRGGNRRSQPVSRPNAQPSAYIPQPAQYHPKSDLRLRNPYSQPAAQPLLPSRGRLPQLPSKPQLPRRTAAPSIRAAKRGHGIYGGVCPFFTRPEIKEDRFVRCNMTGEVSGCSEGYVCEMSPSLSELGSICCWDSVASLWPKKTLPQPPTKTPQSPQEPSKKLVRWNWTNWAPWKPSSTNQPTTTTTQPTSTTPSTTLPSTTTTTTTSSTGRPSVPAWGSGSWNAQWMFWKSFKTTSTTTQAPRLRSREDKSTEADKKTTFPQPVVVTKGSGEEVTSSGKEEKKEEEETPSIEVVLLNTGRAVEVKAGQWEWETTVSLIKDGPSRILVDTGLPADTNIILQGLASEGVRPQEIDLVVVSNGRPDHVGNLNIFSGARHLYHTSQYLGSSFAITELTEAPFMKVSENVEVWKTPGHTREDLTIMVRNVPQHGVVAIAGDLITNKDWYLHPEAWEWVGAWDVATQRENARMVICMANTVIPGHGPMFKVTDKMRQDADCPKFAALLKHRLL